MRFEKVDEELLQVSRRSYERQNAATDYFASTTETLTDPQHVCRCTRSVFFFRDVDDLCFDL